MLERPARLTAQTVRLPLTVVNTVVTEMAEDRTPEPETPGRRLERYIHAHIKRGTGGIRGFCSRSGLTPEVLYSWFRGETEPQLGSITKMANALEVSRVEILAAMDDVTEEPTETMVRRIVRDEQARFLADLAAKGHLRVLPGGPPSRPRGRAPR